MGVLINDQVPVLLIDGALSKDHENEFNATFVEEGDAVSVVGALSLTDSDSGGLLLSAAVVKIVDGMDGSAEVLAVADDTSLARCLRACSTRPFRTGKNTGSSQSRARELRLRT